MTLEIVHGGLLTTVQDSGRPGHQDEGVPVGGPMDSLSLRCANLLVGNDEQAAGLEITIVGPSIRFGAEAVIALAGAELNAAIDGVPFSVWRAATVRAGALLTFRGSPVGCHAYLAVAGGIDVPVVLGSRSTYLRAGFGGLEGRALRSGDVLGCLAVSTQSTGAGNFSGRANGSSLIARWVVRPPARPGAAIAGTIRLIAGAHAHLLSERAREQLFSEEFRISTQSDRMGYRLSGVKLGLRSPTELLSEGVTFGTMQLPPGGDPIILMADRQTTGGYPRIGEVASVDLPVLAQLRPGDAVRFSEIEVGEAQRLLVERESDMRLLNRAIALRREAR